MFWARYTNARLQILNISRTLIGFGVCKTFVLLEHKLEVPMFLLALVEKIAHHGALALLLLQGVLLITLSRLLGAGFAKIKQPLVIAEVTAGILLGPSLMDKYFPDFSALVFPKTSLASLGIVSQVGLVFFMFVIGLELKHELLKGRGKASMAVSWAGIAVPFTLGLILAFYLHPMLAISIPFWSFGLFMGTAMSITAFPVLARILKERGLMKSKVGAVTLTCAAVDDVTAWCVLALVVCFVKATGWIDAVITTAMSLGFILTMWFLVKPLLEKLIVNGRKELSDTKMAIMVVLVAISALTTDMIGIHALFGAFCLGAIFPRQDGLNETVMHKIETLVSIFLLPMFFALSGLRTEIGLINTPELWALTALIIGVACMGKFGGSSVAARLTGLRWRESAALGILMNTRGLMELIVLNIGLELGVLTPTVFTMMVLMALVTTFMTTPLLQAVYPLHELVKDELEVAPAISAPQVAAVA